MLLFTILNRIRVILMKLIFQFHNTYRIQQASLLVTTSVKYQLDRLSVCWISKFTRLNCPNHAYPIQCGQCVNVSLSEEKQGKVASGYSIKSLSWLSYKCHCKHTKTPSHSPDRKLVDNDHGNVWGKHFHSIPMKWLSLIGNFKDSGIIFGLIIN